MKDSYLSYAMSVIVSRALPDVRDGLKPSQRRILVAMNDLNLGPRSKQRKCAKIAGDTSGNYHPHGESVIYPTLVRMAQPFNMRYPLVHGQGNFGSIDGDPPAAMRYTEAKMTAAAAAMMEDLEQDTVDFVPNYEGTRQEPTVLPSRFPNLLVNGSNGIAVGMATSMAPHNLTEVCQALKAVVDRPEITIDELMEYVKGPDFPTGGILCGTYGVREAYRTGRGFVDVRGKAVFEDFGARGNRQRIVITEIPYQINKTVLIEKIADLIKDGRLDGASEVRDESDKDGIRICVECRAGEDAKVVLNRLYEFTQLQDRFSIICIALVNGRPKTLSLKDLLVEYIAYRRIVVTRRTKFLLGKALERLHILEGFLIVLSHMDEVIATIRASADRDDAKKNLIAKFQLSEKQADAIVDLRLHRLTALEREKIEQEHREVTAEVAGYRKILGDPKEVDRIVKEEVEKTQRDFGDARRTDIGESLDDTVPEDLIPDEEMTVTISRKGYVKRLSSGEYRAQRRGGKGIIGTDAQDDDFVEQVFIANNHDYMLLFTDTGRVHWLKVYQLPLLSRYSRGRAIANLLQLQGEEKITRVIPVRDFKTGFLVLATKRGVIKRTELSAFSRPMRGGIIAMGLNDGDALVGVRIAREGDRVLLASKEGQSICFELEDVRPMGRPATGVRGMNLREEDEVVSLILAQPNATVLTVCANGFGKRTPLEEYRVQGRGGFGVINIKSTDRNGAVVGVLEVTDDDDLLIATQQGQVVRTPVKDVSSIGRNTQGVCLVRFKVEGDQVASVGRMVHDDSDTSASDTSGSDGSGGGSGGAPAGV
ncbi:MAG: DNA gyrase subunit A [Planctomycetes bacterium]|nr:DNA gyrase subunit A [Planctomycetota bacterium]